MLAVSKNPPSRGHCVKKGCLCVWAVFIVTTLLCLYQGVLMGRNQRKELLLVQPQQQAEQALNPHATITMTQHATVSQLDGEYSVGVDGPEFEWQRGCPSPGGGPRGVVVTVVAGGRLGNYVWEYLSVWAVARRYGAWPAVPRTILNTLLPIFPSLSVPALEDLAARCDLPHILTQFKATGSAGNMKILEQELNATQDAELDFVAVHVRRTDYINYIKRKFPGSKPAQEDFYLQAMALLRARLAGRRVVFVVVSDDPAWCRAKLQGADVVVAGTGDVAKPAHDLALLAACNHTIFAYGTFALTAAMHNAGGVTVTFDLKKKSDSKNAAMTFGEQLNWIMT